MSAIHDICTKDLEFELERRKKLNHSKNPATYVEAAMLLKNGPIMESLRLGETVRGTVAEEFARALDFFFDGVIAAAKCEEAAERIKTATTSELGCLTLASAAEYLKTSSSLALLRGGVRTLSPDHGMALASLIDLVADKVMWLFDNIQEVMSSEISVKTSEEDDAD